MNNKWIDKGFDYLMTIRSNHLDEPSEEYLTSCLHDYLRNQGLSNDLTDEIIGEIMNLYRTL